MSKRIAVRDLHVDTIDTKPVDFDWDGETYSSLWEYWSADRCQKCNAIVIGQGESAQHSDVDNESNCDGSLSLSPPMMSYYYPVEIDDRDEAARKLVDLPLCVVEVGGKTGLALTGGGMDLSWEICNAFVLLGKLPPLHFCNLPEMAGRGLTRDRQWIIAACLRTCAVAASWAKSRAARLRQTRQWMRERAEQREARS